jgi:hypothetical protein
MRTEAPESPSNWTNDTYRALLESAVRRRTLVGVEDEGHAIGYKVLPRGTPVVTSDGVQLGTVSRVLDNEREHIFDGIVVRTPERRVFVDAPEVARIAEKRVTLTITAAESEQLEEYRGMRGSLEHRTKRSAARWKRRFGR